jgi:hypothetical protein
LDQKILILSLKGKAELNIRNLNKIGIKIVGTLQTGITKPFIFSKKENSSEFKNKLNYISYCTKIKNITIEYLNCIKSYQKVREDIFELKIEKNEKIRISCQPLRRGLT